MKKKDWLRGAVLTWERRNGRKLGSIGSSVIRGMWLSESWIELDMWEEGNKYDFIIFQKVIWNDYFRTYDGIKILDLCDPDWMMGSLEIVKASKMVDAITVSSPGLYEFVSKIVDIPVVHIPDRVHPALMNNKLHSGRAERVVWYGYHHNAEVVLPTILPALAKRGLKLLVVSDAPFETSNNFGVDIENRLFDWGTLKYDLQYGDMILNPQNFGGKFKYKSENKTYIAWAMGLPVVKNVEDLDRFMDADERRKEINARQAEVREKWLIEHSVTQFSTLIDDLCRTRK